MPTSAATESPKGGRRRWWRRRGNEGKRSEKCGQRFKKRHDIERREESEGVIAL